MYIQRTMYTHKHIYIHTYIHTHTHTHTYLVIVPSKSDTTILSSYFHKYNEHVALVVPYNTIRYTCTYIMYMYIHVHA